MFLSVTRINPCLKQQRYQKKLQVTHSNTQPSKSVLADCCKVCYSSTHWGHFDQIVKKVKHKTKHFSSFNTQTKNTSVHIKMKILHFYTIVISIKWQLQWSSRLGICRDRRSCKSFVSCVNFSRKQRSFLHILQVYTHLNVNFLHKG